MPAGTAAAIAQYAAGGSARQPQPDHSHPKTQMTETKKHATDASPVNPPCSVRTAGVAVGQHSASSIDSAQHAYTTVMSTILSMGLYGSKTRS